MKRAFAKPYLVKDSLPHQGQDLAGIKKVSRSDKTKSFLLILQVFKFFEDNSQNLSVTLGLHLGLESFYHLWRPRNVPKYCLCTFLETQVSAWVTSKQSLGIVLQGLHRFFITSSTVVLILSIKPISSSISLNLKIGLTCFTKFIYFVVINVV